MENCEYINAGALSGDEGQMTADNMPPNREINFITAKLWM
jgi:hypothetical protein